MVLLALGAGGPARAWAGAEPPAVERLEIEMVPADPEEILLYDGPFPAMTPGEVPLVTRPVPDISAPWSPEPFAPPPPPSSAAAPAPQSAAPAPLRSFPGMWISLTDTIPPDTHGAVGPNHVASMLNSAWGVWDKSTGNMYPGYPWWPMGLFWIDLGSMAWGAFDPKVIYDQYSRRWFAVALTNKRSPDSHILFAVSFTSDPTGFWWVSAIPADSTGRDWADFPTIGVDENLVTIAVNMARVPGDDWTKPRVWFIDKQTALSGGSITVWYRDMPGFTWQPCHAFGPTPVNYLISEGWNEDPRNPLRPQLRIFRFSYGSTGPVLAEEGYIQADDYGNILISPQPGCSKALATVDTRLANAVLRHGKIWTSHHVSDPASPPGGPVVRWYEIDPGRARPSPPYGAPLQSGQVGGFESYPIYPSIAVNRDECVALGFSYTSPNHRPSGCYTKRDLGDPSGTMEGIRLLKAGEDTYYRPDSSKRNRWGDYSATVVDPDDDHTFWTIQEYAMPEFWPWTCDGLAFPELSGSWGTWWGMFRCPENQPPVIACNDPVVPADPGRCDAAVAPATIADCRDPDGPTVTMQATGPGTYPVGTTSVEITCSDPLPHHRVRKTCRVRVEDREDPTCTPPGPATLECNALGGVDRTDARVQAWLGSASATDNCAVARFTNDAPAFFPSGCGGRATSVTWTAGDPYGNTSTCEAALTVGDTTAPVPSAPAPIGLECNTLGGVDRSDPAVTGWLAGASATDVCEGPVVPTDNAPSFFPSACPPGNETTVTFTATDSCRNSASEDSSVTVQDTRPPVLTVPPPITLECNTTGGVDGSDPQVQAWLGRAAADDVCEGPVTPSNDAPGFFPSDCPPGHTTPANFSAADSCANGVRDTSSITVQDTTPPEVLVEVNACCLWPPNHNLVEVADYVIADDCDAAPSFAGGTVTSDEDPALEPGTGGPVHSPDALVGGGAVWVRAERAGPGGADNGRVYGGISVSGADNCANTGTTTVTDGGCVACPGAVCVPHDQDPKTQGRNAAGSCPATDDGQGHQAGP